MSIVQTLKDKIAGALGSFGLESTEINLEHPADLSHGDYSTNVALALAKKAGKNPRELAASIKEILDKDPIEGVSEIEVAGAGFLNFKLSPEFFKREISNILREGERFGRNALLSGKKVIIEYTDPNPFKEFHIGHLMSNAIGESIARIMGESGAKVVRACWQGDVGRHVAQAIWGMMKKKSEMPGEDRPLSEKVAFLGTSYVLGATSFEEDEAAKAEIVALNKAIFDKSDAEVNSLYETGRKWSLEHFEELYEMLGTKFDHYFFEGIEGREGEKIVREFLEKGVFEESEGAIVFKGEKYDSSLHTRVFINSQGLPTYEAKELGLAQAKLKAEPDADLSIVITASEQSEYFRVVLRAIGEIFPEIAAKTKHIAHGMMRFAEGKMSSRKGNVITGESLLQKVKEMVYEKMAKRELSSKEREHIATDVAVGAIKYSILRQAIGGDIIFDFNTSISFEGDSGPYLQYAFTRAQSVLSKAEKEGIEGNANQPPQRVSTLEKLLYRFPEIVERSFKEYAPHYVATFLIEIAGEFNRFYAEEQIVSKEDPHSPYKIALTSAFATTMKNGLVLLGISAPEKM